MIYPCDDCVVDVMCLKCCDKFIWYMDELKSTAIRDNTFLIRSDARYRRARMSSLTYQRNINLCRELDLCRHALVKGVEWRNKWKKTSQK